MSSDGDTFYQHIRLCVALDNCFWDILSGNEINVLTFLLHDDVLLM